MFSPLVPQIKKSVKLLLFVLFILSSCTQISTVQTHQPTPTNTPSETSCTPEITSVSSFASEQTQDVSIKGSCFGKGEPFSNTNSHNFKITIDPSQASEWNACFTDDHPGDSVTCNVSSWDDNEITFTGFTGGYGQNNWIVSQGDILTIRVWNPLASQEPGECSVEADAEEAKPCNLAEWKRPIIFIPGITGSYLEDAQTPANEAWPQLQTFGSCLGLKNTSNPPAKSPQYQCQETATQFLQLASNGNDPFQAGSNANVDVASSPRQTIGPLGGVLASADFKILWFVAKKTHIYDATWSNLEQSGYHLALTDADLRACASTSQCFIPAAVDWRKSAQFNASRILSLIQHVRALTGSDRVNIMAHSQGGLIANALVHIPASIGSVNRIVTLGTPFLGAAKLLAVLLFKLCEFSVKDLGCAVDPEILQKLIINFPGVMELLPSQLYDEASKAGILIRQQAGGIYSNLSYQEVLQFIQQQLQPLNRDMNLVNAAQQFHNNLDVWDPVDPQVTLMRVVGYDAEDGGKDCQETTSSQTPDFIITCSDEALGNYNKASTIVAMSVGGSYLNGVGDGTVPLFSAGEYNPENDFDMRDDQPDRFYCAISHMGLAQSEVVWQDAQKFFEGQIMLNGIGKTCPDRTDGDLSGIFSK